MCTLCSPLPFWPGSVSAQSSESFLLSKLCSNRFHLIETVLKTSSKHFLPTALWHRWGRWWFGLPSGTACWFYIWKSYWWVKCATGFQSCHVSDCFKTILVICFPYPRSKWHIVRIPLLGHCVARRGFKSPPCPSCPPCMRIYGHIGGVAKLVVLTFFLSLNWLYLKQHYNGGTHP